MVSKGKMCSKLYRNRYFSHLNNLVWPEILENSLTTILENSLTKILEDSLTKILENSLTKSRSEDFLLSLWAKRRTQNIGFETKGGVNEFSIFAHFGDILRSLKKHSNFAYLRCNDIIWFNYIQNVSNFGHLRCNKLKILTFRGPPQARFFSILRR